MRLALFTAFALLALSAGPAPAQTNADGVARIAGAWEIVSQNGRSGCENGQVFTPSADGRYVDLTEPSAPAGAAPIRYIVLQEQPGRILMFIEDEERLTGEGDPVLWWAMFTGENSFRWRRYGWPVSAMTDAEWRRCTT